MLFLKRNKQKIEIPAKIISDEDYTSYQYEHILKMSQISVDNEIRREDSLLTQANHMQTAFAFTTAAIFAALPVCIDNKGNLTDLFFYIWIAIIISFMIISLCFATAAQWRFKTKSIESVQKLKETILDDPKWREYINESYRDAQVVDMYERLYHEKEELNNKRVNLIMHSMYSFYLAIISIVLCFAHATYLLWF